MKNTVSLLIVSSVIVLSISCLAQSGPLPVPSGPLGDVDTAFLMEYTSTMKAIAATHPPYVEVTGSNLVLHHGGIEESKRILPDVYHALKDVAHVPFLTYLELAPLSTSNQELTDAQLSELRNTSEKIMAAQAALPTGHFSDIQLVRQQQMIDGSLELLDKTISAKKIDRSVLDSFAHRMAPLMMENSDEAGCYQIKEMHSQMMKWKSTLTIDEWNRLIAINKSGHQPRYRNVATQYFGWLFNVPAPTWAYPGESARMIYIESLPKTQTGEDELVSVLLDSDASFAFFGNRWRLSEDVLSDGAARCIAQLPTSDRIKH